MGEKKPEESRDNFLPQTLEDLKGKTPEELRKIVDVLDAHLKSLHQDEITGELRDMSSEEQNAFDLGMELRDYSVKKIDEHVRIAEVFRRRPQSVERVYNNIRHGMTDESADIRRLTKREAQERALRILDSRDKSQPLQPDQMDHVDRQIRRSGDIALRIIATENDAYREAWQKLVSGHEGWTLSEEERDAVRTFQEYRAMTEGTGSAGGYGIPVNIKAA